MTEPAPAPAPAHSAAVQPLATQERAALMAAMAEAQGNLSAAARALGAIAAVELGRDGAGDGLRLALNRRGVPLWLNSPMRELVRDFCVNQQFRKDYWVKGARSLSALEQLEALRAQRVILVQPRADVSLKVSGSLGDKVPGLTGGQDASSYGTPAMALHALYDVADAMRSGELANDGSVDEVLEHGQPVGISALAPRGKIRTVSGTLVTLSPPTNEDSGFLHLTPVATDNSEGLDNEAARILHKASSGKFPL